MLSVLLRVIFEVYGILPVLLRIARSLGCARNGVDVCLAALNAAVSLGAGAEDAETAEVEIEEVGRGVDAAQSPIELEVVALIPLLEAS